MIRVGSIAFVCILFLSVNQAQGQNSFEDPDKARFTNAKELMKLGKYGLAMQAFKPLAQAFDGNRYEKIASFYYAVSAYHDDQKYIARDMFLGLLQKFPTWEKLDEINLWLSIIYLEEGEFYKGLNHASRIRDTELIKEAALLKRNFIATLDYGTLDSLFEKYPSNKDIAINLVKKISAQPRGQQDRALLEDIIAEFELDRNKYNLPEELSSDKKDNYQVAVILPFMTDEIKNNPKHLSNDFVIELYEGILTGLSELRSMGINISIHPYDTKKDESTTATLLRLEEMKSMDLLIGPLWPGPVKLVSEFAYEQQINMINPLSNNSEIIGDNPFAFLFMPTNETMGRKAAEFISETIENKNAFVFHGKSDRDSVLAYSYIQEIESHGFNVCHIEGVATEDAKNILDLLTNTVTIEFDSAEFESAELVPASLDPDELDSLLNEDVVEGNLRITEVDFLVIKPDSIGHVFIASNDPALVANTITGLETRGDTVMLVGSERWLEQRVISLGGLERLNTRLIAPTYIHKDRPKYETINSICMEAFNCFPTRNFYIGYELILATGKMMSKMGNRFQYDPGINDFLPGELFQGILYGSENCNQIVPILKFNNSELVVENLRE